MEFKTRVFNNVKVRMYIPDENPNNTLLVVSDLEKICFCTSLHIYSAKHPEYRLIGAEDVDNKGMYHSAYRLGTLSVAGVKDIIANSKMNKASKGRLSDFLVSLNKPSTPIPSTPKTDEIQALKEEIQNLREENRVVKEMYNKAMEQKEKVYTTPDIIKAIEDKLHKAEADVVKYRSILEELKVMI